MPTSPSVTFPSLQKRLYPAPPSLSSISGCAGRGRWVMEPEPRPGPGRDGAKRRRGR